MRRDHVELDAPSIGGSGTVIAYGHWGRPVLVFPAEQGRAWDIENNGLVGRGRRADRGRAGEALLRGLLRRRVVVEPRRSRSRIGPGRTAPTRRGSPTAWWPTSTPTAAGRTEIATAGVSLGAFHAANFALRRADLFPLALCMSGSYDPSHWHGWGERGDVAYFTNPMDYVEHLGGDHLDWLRSRVSLLLVCGQGQWEDTTGALESTKAFAALLARRGIRHELDLWGYDVAARLAVVARAIRSSSPPLLLMPDTTHRIGLLLGTEEDWPTAFETIVGRLGAIKGDDGARHRIEVERMTIEPFDLRDQPRHDLVVDRLAYWYYHPREWLKKVALMDDVYLLNSPFTFQSMEKHAAYCAMIRCGLKVPRTVLVPYKRPPDNARWAYTAAKYNRPFDLEAIAARVGYPLFMKPYDGGQWVGVSRIADDAQLHAAYDASGERLMHLQAAIDGYDVFARSLSIGPETMVMRFRPEEPLHDRYAVSHDFLTPQVGDEVVTISRLINAFFRWEFNSCECLVRGDEVYPDRLRQRVPGRRVDEPSLLLPVGDPRAGEVVRVLRRHRPATAAGSRHAPLLRDRRPRRPLLRGEARGLSAARRRLLRGRALRGVLRGRPEPRRRARARLDRVARA